MQRYYIVLDVLKKLIYRHCITTMFPFVWPTFVTTYDTVVALARTDGKEMGELSCS